VHGGGARPGLPVPPSPLVRAASPGPTTTTPPRVDADACRLWRPTTPCRTHGGGWGRAEHRLLGPRIQRASPRPLDRGDAAGFPMVPLLLKRDEAASGTIRHGPAGHPPYSKIRNTYTWPARHVGGGSTSAAAPEMGQLFRLKASYVIRPARASRGGPSCRRSRPTDVRGRRDRRLHLVHPGEPNAGWDGRIWGEIWRCGRPAWRPSTWRRSEHGQAGAPTPGPSRRLTRGAPIGRGLHRGGLLRRPGGRERRAFCIHRALRIVPLYALLLLTWFFIVPVLLAWDRAHTMLEQRTDVPLVFR